ncbi:MAG: hypothetical protein IT320_05150 [Anaerolineae bacterium]|nr:hypothetical protein [Anaerolineae bacterium]
MRHRKLVFFLQTSGLIMLSFGLLLLMAQPADAQCGSQASSCKNCHEVQGNDPVNNDGTGWHVSHAFGDFCYMCHAGNPQATDETGAHTGMVPPLSDVEASCVQCHPGDLEDRAKVYATTLNVEYGMGGGSSGGSSAPSSPSAPSAPVADTAQQPAPSEADTVQVAFDVPADNELAVDDPNLVDYTQRYNEIVLGQRPVNVGNIILVGLIGLIVVGGGGFILFNEVRLRLAASTVAQVDGTSYPEDVVEMLPALARLKVETRNALKKLVQNPKKTESVVGLINSLGADENPEDTAS